MALNYTYLDLENRIHVDIDFSGEETYFLSGQVWYEGQEKIDFKYAGAHDNVPSIIPNLLSPSMQKAILLAAQRFQEEVD